MVIMAKRMTPRQRPVYCLIGLAIGAVLCVVYFVVGVPINDRISDSVTQERIKNMEQRQQQIQRNDLTPSPAPKTDP